MGVIKHRRPVLAPDGTTGKMGGLDGGVAWSTTEAATNDTWTDGKTIYRKVVTDSGDITAGSNDYAHGITGLDRVIKVEGWADQDDAGSSRVPMPFVGGADTPAILETVGSNGSFELGGGFENVGGAIGRINLTIVTAGRYLIAAHVHVTADNVAAVQESRMRLTNDTVAIASTDTAIGRNEITLGLTSTRDGGALVHILDLDAGDVIELQISASTDSGNTSVQSFGGSGKTRIMATPLQATASPHINLSVDDTNIIADVGDAWAGAGSTLSDPTFILEYTKT